MASYHCLFLDGEGRPAWGERIDAESDRVALLVARDRIGARAAGIGGFAVLPLPSPDTAVGNTGPVRPVSQGAGRGLVAGLLGYCRGRTPRN